MQRGDVWFADWPMTRLQVAIITYKKATACRTTKEAAAAEEEEVQYFFKEEMHLHYYSTV